MCLNAGFEQTTFCFLTLSSQVMDQTLCWKQKRGVEQPYKWKSSVNTTPHVLPPPTSITFKGHSLKYI